MTEVYLCFFVSAVVCKSLKHFFFFNGLSIQHCDFIAFVMRRFGNTAHIHFGIRAIFFLLEVFQRMLGPTLARKGFRATGPRPIRLEGNDPWRLSWGCHEWSGTAQEEVGCCVRFLLNTVSPTGCEWVSFWNMQMRLASACISWCRSVLFLAGTQRPEGRKTYWELEKVA